MQDHPPNRSHALRTGRYSASGQAYLVTTVTLHRQAFFTDWRSGRCVAQELRAAPAETLAWVLMPDHLHWLLVLGEASLAQTVGGLKSRAAIAVNRHLGRQGPLWQRDYHDHALRRDEDVQQVARYVVMNPLRAGLVQRIGDYPLWDAVWL